MHHMFTMQKKCACFKYTEAFGLLDLAWNNLYVFVQVFLYNIEHNLNFAEVL
uniref:Uncharacterized protein n=1 Tax=Anguilla anguilla TaxID=7936 RepID=A0A0E9QQS3_ANGAN